MRSPYDLGRAGPIEYTTEVVGYEKVEAELWAGSVREPLQRVEIVLEPKEGVLGTGELHVVRLGEKPAGLPAPPDGALGRIDLYVGDERSASFDLVEEFAEPLIIAPNETTRLELDFTEAAGVRVSFVDSKGFALDAHTTVNSTFTDRLGPVFARWFPRRMDSPLIAYPMNPGAYDLSFQSTDLRSISPPVESEVELEPGGFEELTITLRN